jgi:hypothetical protein
MSQVVNDAAYRHALWPWGARRRGIIPLTAWGPRHNAGASPSRLPTRGEASLSGQPGEQDHLFDAGFAPDMDDRELARAQEPGKRFWTDTQPPLRFLERNQLRRRGEIQGEVLLPQGRASAQAEVSGHRWHGRGFPSHAQGV